eukprot:1024550-Alexandrium_andersonii.AAC.1
MPLAPEGPERAAGAVALPVTPRAACCAAKEQLRPRGHKDLEDLYLQTDDLAEGPLLDHELDLGCFAGHGEWQEG